MDTESPFKLVSEFAPKGDQPEAIRKLLEGLEAGDVWQCLLGITGSGKTFTVANVIARTGRPALIIAPNKTLAAQLYGEMQQLFPENAVEYFVSYYDYYQPEAYIPTTDTFIEKDAIVNEQIDRMRHSATRSLLSRRDVIIVASVSCIYGIGSAEWYFGMLIELQKGAELRRDELLRRLVDIQYERNDIDFHRGTFRVRGDVVEIFPVSEEGKAIRVEYWGDTIERLQEIDPLRGKALTELRPLRDLPRLALRHAAGEAARVARLDPRGAARAARGARVRRQTRRTPAPRAAHALRPRDAGADGLLLRHRELLAAPLGERRRGSLRRR